MLLLMRKRIGSVIIKVFAFFLILGFGAWGVQDMLGYQVGGGSSGVAEVGGEALPARALYKDVYSEVNRMRKFLGASFNIEQARQLGVIDSVLQRQINIAAIRIGANDLGVAISDRLVRNAIVDQPMFRGLTGNFDRERFQQMNIDSIRQARRAEHGESEPDHRGVCRRRGRGDDASIPQKPIFAPTRY